jgi:hypothetical protein
MSIINSSTTEIFPKSDVGNVSTESKGSFTSKGRNKYLKNNNPNIRTIVRKTQLPDKISIVSIPEYIKSDTTNEISSLSQIISNEISNTCSLNNQINEQNIKSVECIEELKYTNNINGEKSVINDIAPIEIMHPELTTLTNISTCCSTHFYDECSTDSETISLDYDCSTDDDIIGPLGPLGPLGPPGPPGPLGTLGHIGNNRHNNTNNRHNNTNNENYEMIINDMTQIITQRDLTLQESKLLSESIRRIANISQTKNSSQTEKEDLTENTTIHSKPLLNSSLNSTLKEINYNTNMDMNIKNDSDMHDLRSYTRKKDFNDYFESQVVKTYINKISQLYHLSKSCEPNYVHDIMRDGVQPIKRRSTKFTIPILTSLLYFGNDDIIQLCEKYGLDMNVVLKKIRDSPIIKNITDSDIFEKFYAAQTGNIFHVTKPDPIKPDENLLKSLDTPNKTQGILYFKEQHKHPKKSSRTMHDNNCCNYDYKNCIKHNSSDCKCIACKRIKILDNSFYGDLKILMTDNPFENILRLEQYTYAVLKSGLMKEHTFISGYSIKNNFSAVAYINDVKNKTMTCGIKECYDYFYENFKLKIKEPIPSNHQTNTIKVHNTDTKYMQYANILSNNKNITSYLQYSKSEQQDMYGMSLNTLWLMANADDQFKQLLTNMTEMMEMSTQLPAGWCEVDQYPKIKRNDASTKDPSNFRLITHHKLFVNYMHTSIAKKLHDYLIRNEFLDVNLQKAFNPDNGTWKSAKELYTIQGEYHLKKLDLIMMFLDVKNAYGSLNHEFIKFVMKQYNVPRELYEYIVNFYTNLKVRIVSNGETSDYFPMERGILQGDHLSNIIFIMCIGYILNIINEKFKHKKPTNTKNIFSCFVDDILTYAVDKITCKSIVDDFVRLNRLLKTGFEINFDKSYILLVGNKFRSQLKDGLEVNVGRNQTRKIRLLEFNEIIKYLGSYVDASSEYDVIFMDHVNQELISEFRYAENEMIKKNILLINSRKYYNINRKNSIVSSDISNIYNKQKNITEYHNSEECHLYNIFLEHTFRDNDKYNDTKNKPISEDNNKIIIQKVYDYLISKIEWRLVRMIMPIEKMNDLVIRLDNITKYYSNRWGTYHKSPKNNKNNILSVKNAVQIILNENNNNFKKALDDTVVELYQKNRYTIVDDNYSYSDPYDCLNIFHY